MLIRPLGRASGAIDLPQAAADTYLRRNSDNSGYDAVNPLQVADELIAVRDWRGRNVLINGAFRVWQEGVSFTQSTTGAAYTADQWRVQAGTGGTVTTTRQAFTLGQTDVPGEPEYYLSNNWTVAPSSQSVVYQAIEGVRTLAGQTVTVSFYAKSSGFSQATIRLIQDFGSGGSASVVVTGPTIALSGTFSRYTATFSVPSLSGKTIGTSDNLLLQLLLPSGVSGIFDIADIQLEPGSVATPFERRPIGEELALCQRYFLKSMNGTPAHGVPGSTGAGAVAFGVNGRQLHAHVNFPVEMRANPTIAFYSYGGGTSGAWRDMDNVGDGPAASTLNVGRMSFIARSTANATADRPYVVHYTANARL